MVPASSLKIVLILLSFHFLQNLTLENTKNMQKFAAFFKEHITKIESIIFESESLYLNDYVFFLANLF